MYVLSGSVVIIIIIVLPVVLLVLLDISSYVFQTWHVIPIVLVVVVVVVVVVAALNVGATLSSRPRCGTCRSRKDSASSIIRHRMAPICKGFSSRNDLVPQRQLAINFNY